MRNLSHKLLTLLALVAAYFGGLSGVMGQVDIPGSAKESGPLAVPGTGLKGEYWKRPPVSILTDGAANRANGIDNQIAGFGAPDGRFNATRLVYTGNDLTLVKDWLGSDGASFTGTTNNLDDGAFRFTGFVNITAPGSINIGTTSDDGSRIKIGGIDVINNDGSHGDTTVSADVNFLEAGLYPVEITFFNGDWTSDGNNHSGNPDPAVHGGANFRLLVGGANITPEQVALLHPSAASPLPEVTQIGRNKIGSSAYNGGGSFTIVGGGNDIWANFDEFTYANREVTGDFDVSVRVESLEANARWTKAGLMIRESAAEDSRMIFLRVTPPDVPTGNGGNGANDTFLSYRTGRSVPAQNNDGEHEDRDAANPTPSPNYPNAWLRVTRVGSVFTAYNSADGVFWDLVGSQDTATWQNGKLAGTALVGLGVSRHSANPTARAEFRNFALTQGSAGNFDVIGASSRGNPTGVRVEFSQPVGDGALTAANYTLSGGGTNGPTAVLSVAAGPNPATVQLTTSALVEGAAYTVTVNDGVVKSAAGTALNFDKATATFTHGEGFEARAIRVAHSRIGDSGAYGESLARSRDLPGATLGYPNVESGTAFEDPIVDNGDNEQFSSKIAGVLNITTSGAYKFYCSSDDFGILYLSTDDDPANKVEIAREPAWNGRREYIAGGNQASRGDPPANISASINLEAGKKYYLEQIYTEGGGGNNGSTTWLPPGGAAVANGSEPIPASAFTPARMKDGNVFSTLGPVSIVKQPQGVLKLENETATFIVRADGTPNYTYQWRKNGENIAGATGRSYTTPPLAQSDNGATYSVVVANEFSSATSAEAVLNVGGDTTAPTVTGVRQADATFNNVLVTFSETVTAATAQNVANYSIPGLTVNSATLRADNRSVILAVTPALTLGASYTATIKDVKDRSFTGYTIAPNPTVVTFQAYVFTRGFTVFDAYNGTPGPTTAGTMGGNAVSVLTSHPSFPNSPSETLAMPAFDTRTVYPNDGHEAYGGRISGAFIPPVTGSYIFYLVSDDASELWLSTDASPANKVKIQEETGCCGNFAGHPTAPIALTAGQNYYIECLFKEGTGGDYARVAVQLDDGDLADPNSLSPIAGGLLGQLFDPTTAAALAITQQPAPVSGFENGRGVFTVAATSTPAGPIAYQWQKDNGTGFNDIPFANSATLTLEPLLLSDNGASIRCVVSVPGRTVNSAGASLSVVVDNTPPGVVSVVPGSFFEKITINYDEKVDATDGVDAFNYALSDGTTALTLVAPGVLSADGRSVTFQIDPTTPMLEDRSYTLTISNVKDLAGNAITTLERTFRSPVFSCGFLLFETFNGSPGPLNAGLIGGTAIAGMTSHPTYPNSPSETFFLPGFDTRLNSLYATDAHENYGGRIRGLFVPPASGNWIFYLRSDDASQLFLNPAGADAAGAVMLTEEPGCCGAFEGHASAPQALTAGQRYYIEALYKEGGGGDYCQVAARLEGETTPLSPIPANQLGVYADATGATINITQQPASQTFLIIPPSGDGAAVLDQNFNSGDGGFTAVTDTPFKGTGFTYVAAAGSWQVNQEAPENNAPNTSKLSSPSLNVGRAGYVQVTFSHRWSVEGDNWDGCALEVSVNGGAFTKVPGTAFTAGGYNGAVRTGSRSILTGQEAWVGDSPNHQDPGYVSSTAGLGYMNAGDTVVLRFVYAGDTNTRGNYVPSWEIDSLKVTDGNAPSTATFTVGANASLPGNPNQAIFYVWQRAVGAGFANVPGASGSTLTIAPTAADNGARFRCVLYIPGAVRTTDVATLTVAQPNTPPQFTCGPSQISTQGFGAQIVTGWATDISPHSITRVPIAYSSDFSALPAGATLVGGKTDGPSIGSGVVSNGVLRLTVAENSAWGVFYTPPISALVESYVINLKAYVGGGTCCGDPLGGGATTAADGFSINVANNLPAAPGYGNPGEEGAGNGLSVQFDTWDNGGGEAPVCDVVYATALLARVPLNTPHISQGAGVPRFIPIRVAVHANGTVDVDYDGTNVHSGVVLPGYVPAAGLRLGLGARTGGANDNHWIDDLQIEAFSPDASAAEAGQTVSFIVTTDHPEYFSVQPAVSSDGTLSYRPSATASGLAKVTIRAMDNGGTANGGSDTSAPCTIDINIIGSGGGVNNPPQVYGKDVYTDQGVPVSFTIDAFDPDGDPLTYMLLSQPPAGAGVLTLNGNVVTYTPAPGYVGMFMFDYKVCDPFVCTFGNNLCIFVRPGSSNTPPTARIVATPTSDFAPYLTNDVLISCNYSNASIRLNGFLSSDAESPNSELAFRWFLEPMSLPFGEGVVVSNRLELGTQTVRLDVTDPQGATGSKTLTLDVITVKEGIDISIQRVEDYDGLTEAEKRKFIEILKVAGISADRDHVEGEPHGQLTVLLLELFQYKVYQDLYAIDPVEAECWISWTEDIIQAELICAIECDYAHTQNPQ